MAPEHLSQVASPSWKNKLVHGLAVVWALVEVQWSAVEKDLGSNTAGIKSVFYLISETLYWNGYELIHYIKLVLDFPTLVG